jgi:hypothetical protein
MSRRRQRFFYQANYRPTVDKAAKKLENLDTHFVENRKL